MLELLFLLLPIAAAYGWYMGRRSVQQDKQQEASRLSREYVTGVNFLLSNQQDEAVDLFLDMLKEDSNAVEAHLTLGNLFRSRGEVDRAIRIHQSLMESASLTFDQRLLVIQQLGRDYMVAGVYDRAEGMFTQLTGEVDFKRSALQQLLQIYQLTSEWQKAIDTAEKLVKAGEAHHRQDIAHFYCELALLAMSGDSLDKAISLLKKAESADQDSARVSIMLGRIYMEQNEPEKAISAMSRVLEQDTSLVCEVLPMMQECYKRLIQPIEWHGFLKRCVEKGVGSTAELMLSDIIESQQGREAAQAYVAQQLQRHPTMRIFNRLMDYHIAETHENHTKECMILMRNIVSEQIHNKPGYRCMKCGFASHSLYWHCPSCRGWSTIKPIHGLDGQ